MGKKRIITKSGGESGEGVRRASARGSKKRVAQGVLHVQATFNNTKLLLSDTKGNALAWSSSGSLGFKGAKKGTPFAAGKVAEIVLEKAEGMGVKEVDIVVKGVGSGRESAIRTFVGRGMDVSSIKDITPIPHNGPRAKKPRRV
ncbi:30S ribosomal protein S11 [bacterium]|nr:30S ribosomal protein S11 [bacterium]|tara:strand:+ start:9352 stop:9783 length:432 start_codon:yes stop_codon:yes gene_type:complete